MFGTQLTNARFELSGQTLHDIITWGDLLIFLELIKYWWRRKSESKARKVVHLSIVLFA